MSALGIRTIIVATDLTDQLIPAVQTAAQLARLTDADLHIIHTTEAPVADARLTDHLLAADVTPTDQIEARIVVGPPGAAITQEAFRLQANVIVLGPHRPGGSRLGSTAYRVLRGAQTPCLMLPAQLPLPINRVLVPLDVSTPSQGALAIGLTWTSALRHRQHDQRTRLVALHVAADGHTHENAAHLLQKDVDAVCRLFNNDCAGVEIIRKVVDGIPSTAILSAAEREDADLIVMGTRGKKLDDAELGSVSLDVVTHARRPVLLVPPGIWQLPD